MIALLIILALAAETPPPEPSPAKPIITSPSGWLQRPSAEDLRAAYPPAALASKLSGRATIACIVTAEGTLTDCAAVGEEPADMGFGAAALSLASKFRMRPMTRDGQPPGGARVRIPITFRP